MPPIVALTICTIFVLWLLRLEHKQSPDMSPALWIPTIWLLVIASKPLAVWFEAGGPDMEAGSPMDRAFLIGLGCIGLIIIARRHFTWSNLIKDNIWVVILIFYMFISISWSDMPFVSSKRLSRSLVALIMGLCMATERDPSEALQSVFRRLIYVLIPFSLLLIKYYPHLGVIYASWSGMQMWTGVTLHKNCLCNLCFFAIFVLIWTFIKRWQGRDVAIVWYQKYVEIYLLFLSIWLFMGPYHSLTTSATSMISLTIGLTAFIGLLWMKKRGKIISANTLTLIIVFIIIYGTITPFLGGLTGIDISSTVGRDESLTGRSDIWANLVPYALAKPFLGYGFGGFWTDELRDKTFASEAHNGYLDIILNIGFIGLFFSAMFLVMHCRNAQREMTNNFDWGALWLCFLIMTVVHNLAESSTTSFDTFNFAILLFFSFSGTANKKMYDYVS